jgi:hypothetical protein
MTRTLFSFCLLLLLFGCNNYGLRDKLENPGGGSNSGGTSSSPPPGPPPTYRIFVTTNNFNGDIGISGADLNCQSEGDGIAAGRTWKAMLVDGTNRRACSFANCPSGISENHNWVLKPNAAYVRPSGTLIGNTNDRALLTFPLSNSIGESVVQPWTGLNTDWTTDGTNNCNGWTNAGSYTGAYGQDINSDAGAIRFDSSMCASARPLYCVEQ